MAKTMLGIDIGVCELKMVLWDGARVKDLLTVPMLDNLVRDGVIVSYDAMADFIKEIVKSNRISGEVALVLPPSHTFLRRLSMPKMTTAQLNVNLPYEFRDFLTQAKDKYYYDYLVNGYVKAEEGDGECIDLLAACIPKDVISDYRDMFKRAGLKLALAVPTECAYLNIIRHQKDYEGREFAFVDFGQSSTRLFIFTGAGYEVTRVIEMGMVSVRDAIAEAFTVDEHTAASYMRTNFENCLEGDGPRNVYDAIAADLRKALNFYSFNNRESNLTELWCCGGGVQIPGLLNAVAESTEMKLNPIDDLLPEVSAKENAGSFVAAIGAAVQGGK